MAVGWPSSSARPQSGRRYAAGAVLPRNCDYLRQTGAVFVVQLKDGFVSLVGRSFFLGTASTRLKSCRRVLLPAQEWPELGRFVS